MSLLSYRHFEQLGPVLFGCIKKKKALLELCMVPGKGIMLSGIQNLPLCFYGWAICDGHIQYLVYEPRREP